jgi:hypothetical protein
MADATKNAVTILAAESFSTKADQNIFGTRPRAFGNQALIKELQTRSAAFLQAKQAFHDAQASKANSPEQN